MSRKVLAAAVGALLVASNPLPAQLVNGGFETPPAPAGGLTRYNVGNDIGGWTVVGGPGTVDIISSTFTFNGFSFPTHDGGAQFLDLTGDSNSPTGVEQTVVTVPGSAYDLSFWVGNVIGPAAGVGSTSTVRVFIDGSELAPATNASGGGTTIDWLQFTRSFVATGPSTTIRFINGDPANDTANGIDDVTLAVGVATVPEPATVALVAGGLVALAAVRRRRG